MGQAQLLQFDLQAHNFKPIKKQTSSFSPNLLIGSAIPIPAKVTSYSSCRSCSILHQVSAMAMAGLRLGGFLRLGLYLKPMPKFAPVASMATDAPRDGHKIFVGRLPWGIDDNTLAEAFSSFGHVVNAKVVMDKETNESKGFGFVGFANQEDANAALAMDGESLGGRSLRVNLAETVDRARSGNRPPPVRR